MNINKENVKSYKSIKYTEPFYVSLKTVCRFRLNNKYYMITIRKATPEDAAVIIDFQQKMAWETEQMTLFPK